MTRSSIFATIMLLMGVRVGAQNYPQYIRIIGDSIVIMAASDSIGVPFTHFAELAQFYKHNALGVRVGNMVIAKGTGDSSSMRKFDHPLSHAAESPLLPYYEGGSSVVINPVVSESFVLEYSDTLIFYREAITRWPAKNDDGTAFNLHRHVKIRNPDSCLFITEVVTADQSAVVTAVDTVVFHPVDSTDVVSRFVSYRCDSTDAYRCFRIRYTLSDSSYAGASLRLRVRPEFYFVGSQSDTARCLLVGFFWSVSPLPFYVSHLTDDTLLKAGNMRENAARGRMSLVVIPNRVTRTTGTVSVSCKGASGEHDILVFNQTGRLMRVMKAGFHSESTQLEAKELSPSNGVIYIAVRVQDEYHVGKVIITR